MIDKNFPPSLNRFVSKYDRDGNPRPEEEIQADLKYRADRERWRKENGYSRDSHWTVRRMFEASDIDGFRKMLVRVLGPEEAATILAGISFNSQTAASVLLMRARAHKAL
ncbi:MAG: hypothetical protein JSS22_11585, partial [Proteobacteria bacterium]|nr:hypothetical protein [Pseudomonadota bacterium]